MTYTLAYFDELLPKIPARAASAGPVQPPEALSPDDQVLMEQVFERDRLAAKIWQDDPATIARYVHKEDGTPDAGKADWAVLRPVLRATGLDVDRTARLLRQSKRYESRAERWDEWRGPVTFLEYELRRAVDRWGQDEPLPTPPAPRTQGCDGSCGIAQQRELHQSVIQVLHARALKPIERLVAIKLAFAIYAGAPDGVVPEEGVKVVTYGKTTKPIVDTTTGEVLGKELVEYGLAEELGVSRNCAASAAARVSVGPEAPFERISDGPKRGENGEVFCEVRYKPRCSGAIPGALREVARFKPEAIAPKPKTLPSARRCKHHPSADIAIYKQPVCTYCNRATEPRHLVETVTNDATLPPITDPNVTGDVVEGASELFEAFTRGAETPVRKIWAPGDEALSSVGTGTNAHKNWAPGVGASA